MTAATETLPLITPNYADPFILKWTSEELVIRYGIKVTIEADDIVDKQKSKLNEIYYALQQAQSTFEPGKWYFAGQPFTEKQ